MEPYRLLEAPPTDKTFGILKEALDDTRPDKVNVAIGVYVDATGRTVCFDAVKRAFERIAKDPETGYLTPVGDVEFREQAQKLLFCSRTVDPRVASVQSPSGTGALTLAGELAKLIIPADNHRSVYISDPTWPVHNSIYGTQLGYRVKNYSYWNPETKQVNFEAMRKDLIEAPRFSIIVAHACAHNPTGQDLSHEQWDWLFDLCIDNQHFLILDCAYQGFATGDFEKDSWSVNRAYEVYRTKAPNRLYQFAVAQSFAKNMSLYGHRTGCCHVVCKDSDTSARVVGHMGMAARRIWSNPPRLGSDVCKLIWKDEELKASWLKQLKQVSQSMMETRRKLRTKLEAAIPGTKWDHLTNQIGMFAYTGLNTDQCKRLRKDYGIYLLDSGRICVASITDAECQRIADAVANVF